MGCCCCCWSHSSSTVLNDPAVTISARVGDIYFDFHYYQSYNIGGCSRGLMYIKQDRLYYVSTCCGDHQCCCKCSSCCRDSFDLQNISSVEVINDQSFPLRGGGHGSGLRLQPGLKVTIKQSTNNKPVTILVQMSDAREFALHLQKYSITDYVKNM